MKSVAMDKIVWAVDTMENPEHYRNAQHLIGALTRATSAEVFPVHILGHPFAHPAKASEFEQAYHALAEKRLSEISKTGKVLVDREGSTRSSVNMLLSYAKDVDADAIVVATHSRSGVSRFLMGSFAETLLLLSKIPVITVNPQSKVREKISNILLPTTFQAKFREGFERVVMLAKVMDAKLTVFFREPYVPPVLMSPLIEQHILQETEERKREAAKWQTWAAQNGVPVIVHFDEKPGVASNEILKLAEERDFDLIAMVSQADAFSVNLIGSTCRQVVRSASCPVWVINHGE